MTARQYYLNRASFGDAEIDENADENAPRSRWSDGQ
jgi:hypothetical protein